MYPMLKSYFKRIACLMVLITMLGFVSGMADSKASAGSFATLADTGYLKLGDDEKWEKRYDTALGSFKIRFRKLRWSSEEKRYHLIVWWNGKRIADGYSPENGYGYAFQVFEDEATERVFVAIRSVGRVVLFGYDPKNEKMESFVNSANYYSNDGKYPYITVDEDKDLQLGFLTRKGKEATKYKLFWNESANWFGYKDVTPRWTPPTPPPAPAYTPSVSNSYSEPETSIYEEEHYGS